MNVSGEKHFKVEKNKWKKDHEHLLWDIVFDKHECRPSETNKI